MVQGETVAAFEQVGPFMNVRLGSGETLRPRLLVAADGIRSGLREKAGIKTVHFDYGQSGIVTTVAHERPHHGRAEEHFMPSLTMTTTHGSPYRYDTRVPLVFTGPNIGVGSVESPVLSVDVAPTLVTQIGLPHWPDVDGRDLSPLFPEFDD